MGVRPPLPLSLLRVANPVVRRVLGSRVHRLLSGSLVLLEYEGRTSGRTFAIPLRYAETVDGQQLVTVAVDRSRKLWWRTFTQPRRAVVVLRGARRDVRGMLVEGARNDDASATYAARFPRSAGLLEHAAVVVFERTG